MQVTILVIDSFGIGALPDARAFGDAGSNTALHICQQVPGKKWPTLKQLGLGNCSLLVEGDLPGCEAVEHPSASWGVMAEKSPGKDTTTGHWEIAGIELERAFHTFSQEHPSFPAELVEAFEEATGRKMLGNVAASGTEIIQELGEEHLETGFPIVYTSADSVFQIAAHEEIIPVEELYRICRISRKLVDPYHVARVIARPFTGTAGNFTRTRNRRDFSIDMPYGSVLEHLQESGVHTVGVGKIGDIFLEKGLTESFHDKGNTACLERTRERMCRKKTERELVFVNLVDTDMIYGHRRDVEGYYRAVQEIDTALPGMMDALSKGDVLIITADHGCDPTYKGSDHTREYVPLLVYRKGSSGKDLGIRKGFSDVAQSLCTLFETEPNRNGTSFF